MTIYGRLVVIVPKNYNPNKLAKLVGEMSYFCWVGEMSDFDWVGEMLSWRDVELARCRIFAELAKCRILAELAKCRVGEMWARRNFDCPEENFKLSPSQIVRKFAKILILNQFYRIQHQTNIKWMRNQCIYKYIITTTMYSRGHVFSIFTTQ